MSTAADSAALLRAALRVPVIRRYVGMDRATLSDGRVVESTDNLLGALPGFAGGKTGHTALAGWSQVGFARFQGVGITAAVLGSPTEAQRDRDLAALLRFGLASYRPSRVVDGTGRTHVSPSAGGARPSRSSRRAPSSVLPRPGGALVERVVAPVVATLPVRAGQRLGTRRRHATGRASSRARRSSRPARSPSRRSRRRRAGWRGDPSTVSWGSCRDHHRDAQRGPRPVGDRPDPPARPAPPRERRADARRREGHQHRPGAQAARQAGGGDRSRRGSHRDADRRGAHRRGDPQRLRAHRRRVADVDARGRPDVRDADGDQRVGPEGERGRARDPDGQAPVPVARHRARRLRGLAATRRRGHVLRRGVAGARAARRPGRPRHGGRAVAPRAGVGAVARVAEPARGRAARRPGAVRRRRLPDGARRDRGARRAQRPHHARERLLRARPGGAPGPPLPGGHAAARAGVGRRRRRRAARAVADGDPRRPGERGGAPPRRCRGRRIGARGRRGALRPGRGTPPRVGRRGLRARARAASSPSRIRQTAEPAA